MFMPRPNLDAYPRAIDPTGTRTPTASRRRLTSVLGAVAVVVLSGCSIQSNTASSTSSSLASSSAAPSRPVPSTAAPSTSQTPTPAEPPSTTPGELLAVPAPGTAAELLSTLPVKGRAPMTGYSRAQFGPAWADVDHNGCDTRNDILNRDLLAVSWRAGTHDCVVITGTLDDPYTGTTIPFEKANATAVQIDHVVALGDAWQTGAQGWAPTTREQFANDPLNLLAVDGPANEQKSDSDAASWLPPNKAFRCTYVARQITVKAAYKLWVTGPEHDAMASVLAGCPGQPVANAGKPAATSGGIAPSPPTSPPAATAVSPPAAASSSGVTYANCAAARAAGVAPIHIGQPGYSRKLDRDGDGIACE
jgi:hypothetical protein